MLEKIVSLDWNTVISTAVGALAGSTLTLIATMLAHKLDLSKQQKRESDLIFGLLQGIHDELETLWDSYMDGVGHQLESLQSGEFLNMYWPVTQEYFTVYNNNAFLIGKINDHDLRRLIVSSYSKTRGLIDSYRLNNDLLQKYEHIFWIHQETQSDIHRASMDARNKTLIQYAETLKESHSELKKQMQELLRALRKKGVLSNSK